jgi:4-amino-4-deoxychorismate mutase
MVPDDLLTEGAVVANTGDGLEELRAQLDMIDLRLLDTLRDRIKCCEEIARYKREHKIPMMQSGRITIVQDRAARYASKNGLSEHYIHELYELIIAETCRVEDLIIDAPLTTARRAQRRARRSRGRRSSGSGRARPAAAC